MNAIKLLLAAFAGFLIGLSVVFINTSLEGNIEENTDPEPLYWVAPMDPNYRRDVPGKSPMGMDLVPVYQETGGGAGDTGLGTIKISPEVINNLGVRTASAALKTLKNDILTVGYVQYDQDKLIHIHPRVSGWVEKLYVKATGDPVTKGAPLYDLYSPELVNAQEELLLALKSKDKQLVQATENRLRALQIPRKFIESFKRKPLIQQTVTFYAPQQGVVDNLHIREGFFVQPGTTMLSIGALDQVWVEAEIFERQAALVKINNKVSMTLDYLPAKVWLGKVDYIYPTLDKQTRTMRIRLRFKNPDQSLKPNMFAQVTVHTDRKEPVLAIPREALIRTGEQDRVVIALGEGRFKSLAVKIGQQDRHWVEILEGLEEGESIVSSAQFLLDSESSKTSDFKRMQYIEEQAEADAVWVAGEILEVMPDKRMVNTRHDAIEKWSWPEMMMAFPVNEKLAFESLAVGTVLQMELTRHADGTYEISEINIMSGASSHD